jgi:hypothetical protein
MKTSIDSTRRRRVRAASAVIGLALAASTGAAIAEDTLQGQMAADLGARVMDTLAGRVRTRTSRPLRA